MNYFFTSSVLCFSFSFFDARVSVFRRQRTLFMHCLYTIYETHNHFIQKKKNIKNEFYDTIHTFKIYFITVFSVFNKINYIQTESKKLRFHLFWCKTISGNGFTPKCVFGCA